MTRPPQRIDDHDGPDERPVESWGPTLGPETEHDAARPRPGDRDRDDTRSPWHTPAGLLALALTVAAVLTVIVATSGNAPAGGPADPGLGGVPLYSPVGR